MMKLKLIIALSLILFSVIACKKELVRDNPNDDKSINNVHIGVSNPIVISDDNNNGIAETGENIKALIKFTNLNNKKHSKLKVSIIPQNADLTFAAPIDTFSITNFDINEIISHTYSYSVNDTDNYVDSLTLLFKFADEYGNVSQSYGGIPLTIRNYQIDFYVDADLIRTNSSNPGDITLYQSQTAVFAFYVTNSSDLPVDINTSSFTITSDNAHRVASYNYAPTVKQKGVAPGVRVKVGTLSIVSTNWTQQLHVNYNFHVSYFKDLKQDFAFFFL